MRPLPSILLLLASAILPGCTDKGDPVGDDSATLTDTDTPDGIVSVTDLSARNLVVVHVDTLRRDHLLQYGYSRDTTPGMHTRDWKVITGEYGTTSWTVPSTGSALTGLIPEHHGAVRVDEASEIESALTGETLAEVLGAQGFATGFFSSNSILVGESGFDRGFDISFLQDDFETVFLAGIATEATDWLATVPADQRFFVWLQPMDVHLPYSQLPEYRGTWSDPDLVPFSFDDPEPDLTFRNAWTAADEAGRAELEQVMADLYDEQILSLDGGLTQLLDSLEASGRLEDTLVVVTSDHGETLGDAQDGVIGHGGNVRQELVALPWMMWHPRLEAAPSECLSSNVDLMPTVLAGLGVAAPAGLDGQVVPDACRDYALFDVYKNKTRDAGLDAIGATDGRYAVNYDCFLNRFAGYDLAADPAMLAPQPIHGDPNYDGLAEPLDAYLADVVAQYPTVSCSPTR